MYQLFVLCLGGENPPFSVSLNMKMIELCHIYNQADIFSMFLKCYGVNSCDTIKKIKIKLIKKHCHFRLQLVLKVHNKG